MTTLSLERHIPAAALRASERPRATDVTGGVAHR